jgi:hypothetical protein
VEEFWRFVVCGESSFYAAEVAVELVRTMLDAWENSAYCNLKNRFAICIIAAERRITGDSRLKL